MKTFLPAVIFFCLFLNPLLSLSQVKGGQHTKLFDLYALEKYEDCAFKAEGMVENEKYRKDPEPLLYLSMCMLRIFAMDSGKLDQQYKYPLKESLKYAKKFRSKDKDGNLYNTNKAFFDELKATSIIHANVLYNQGQYGKAAAILGLIHAFDERDQNVKFMKGVCDVLAKNTGEGSKSIQESVKMILSSKNDSAASSDPVSALLLADAMIIYADYLNKNKMADSAKKTITIAKEIFPNNFDVKNTFNQIHGLPVEEKPKEVPADTTEKRYEFHKPENKEGPK